MPFTALFTASEAAEGTSIMIGAQNMHDAEEGAFTGEISSRMLQDAGSRFVLIGHSERRHLFGESNAFIARKLKRALASGLKPILCIGETEAEREQGRTQEVLNRQLLESLPDHPADLILAYEPVWAIGTGKTATAEIAEEAHAFCRSFLSEKWGASAARKIPILYGGSVKPDNIKGLTQKPNINGALVGGASLNPQTFAEIISNAG